MEIYPGLPRIIVTLACLCGWVSNSPLRPTDDTQAMEFLRKYAYMGSLNPDSQFAALTDEEAYDSALRMYQDSMGLNETGQLDAATMEMMAKPRCGLVDMINMADMSRRRRKRYAHQGSVWPQNSKLSYKFVNYSPDMSQSLIKKEFRRAFDMWSSVSNLEFVQNSEMADIEILFARGEHGDGASGAFDGEGGILAHAYYPQFGGDLHLDEDEYWTANTAIGRNLFQVALHELGHSLGLSHSTVRSAVMFPTYFGYNSSFNLDTDDIRGIQTLYGYGGVSPGATSIHVQPTLPPGDDGKNSFCRQGHFDAIGRFNGDTIAFSGNWYAKLDHTGIAPGYPRRIGDDWPGLDGNVDAVLDLVSKNRIYVFKGSQYWRYEPDLDGRPQLLRGYPRLIADGLPGVPDDIDAAFVWGANGRTYVFKGLEYYRLNENKGTVDYGYPKAVASWRIGTGRVDAAFVWDNDKTYFFGGDNFYRYDDITMQTDQYDYGARYPRPIRDWWLGCPVAGPKEDQRMEMDEVVPDEFTEVTRVAQDDVRSGQPIVHQLAAPALLLSTVFAILLC